MCRISCLPALQLNTVRDSAGKTLAAWVSCSSTSAWQWRKIMRTHSLSCLHNMPCVFPFAAICAGPVSENSALTLNCTAAYGPGSLISAVHFASYGTATGTCAAGFVPSSCAAPYTLGVVAGACVGQRSYSVPVTTTYFGGVDPCSGTGKYLVAIASCMGERERVG